MSDVLILSLPSQINVKQTISQILIHNTVGLRTGLIWIYLVAKADLNKSDDGNLF